MLRGPPHAPVIRLAAKAAAGLSKSARAVFALGDERLLEAARGRGRPKGRRRALGRLRL
ncbi:MAG: hypothetical protein TU35_007725 [Thermoproteus sp. AZ2]|uniref:Uncharacterized protein n=1 Tax=Thermoproteus sp. AZ2 TaxID=1609232 RepID=A0ACC6V2G7_9CREN